MDRPRKRRREDDCLSIVYYVVRNKRNPQLFYANRAREKGWMRGIKKATVYRYNMEPRQIVKRFGKENAEVVSIHGTIKTFQWMDGFVLKNIKTGQYIRPTRDYKSDLLWVKSIKRSRVWLSEKMVAQIQKHIYKWLPQYADQLEIIKVQIFYDNI